MVFTLLSNIKDKLLESRTKPKIFVIGDLMIDHYVFGSSNRLSPEAPVPVVLVEKETIILGGAANVAQNLVAYNAEVSICGVIGKDNPGEKLIQMLKSENVNTSYIFADAERVTTNKTRIIAGNHHITRIDREQSSLLSETMADNIFDTIKPILDSSDIILLSDYNKGLFSPYFLQAIIQYANTKNKRVIIDPKGTDFLKYKDAYIIKPNKKELANAAQVEKLSNRNDLEQAAFKLIALTGVQYLVVTLSEEGIAIFGKDNKAKYFPVKATEVFDVTGAGDTVIATLANFLALGLSIEESCELANHAAAIVVKHIGSAVVSLKELFEHIENNRD